MTSNTPMTSPDEVGPAAADISIQDIIFSCSICQLRPSEIYANAESNLGFHSGVGNGDGIVTKLWITECTHIVCNKHLPGGAAPFHAKGEPPQAPCPHCMETRGDDSLKNLFPIRNIETGDYDENIPSAWFNCPPMRFDDSIPGTEAVRFQYMSLTRYAIEATKHWNTAETQRQAAQRKYYSEHKHCLRNKAELVELEDSIASERTQKMQLETELAAAKSKKDKLEDCEKQLDKWKTRRPMINHYLSSVPKMSQEITNMRNELRSLGYQVSEQSYTFRPKQDSQPSQQQTRTPSVQRAATPVHVQQQVAMNRRSSTEVDQSSSARKRKYAEYDATTVPSEPFISNDPLPTSRSMMPPPIRRPQAPESQIKSREPPFFVQPRQAPFNQEQVPPSSQRREPAQHAETTSTIQKLSRPQALPFQLPSFIHPQTRHSNGSENLQPSVRPPRPMIYGSQSLEDSTQSNPQDFERSPPVYTQSRMPLQELSDGFLNRHAPSFSGHNSVVGDDSVPRHHQQTVASVSSPFFKRSDTVYQTSPPPRPSAAQAHETLLRRPETRGRTSYHTPPMYSRAPTHAPLIRQSLERTDYEPQYIMSRPPTRQQSYSQRPYHEPSQSQPFDRGRRNEIASRQQTAAPRNRITLPKIRTNRHLQARNGDYELGQIQGARRGDLRSSQYHYSSGPRYEAPRTLYTRTGPEGYRS